MYFLEDNSNIEFSGEPIEKYQSPTTCRKQGALRAPFQGRDLSIVRNYSGLSVGGIHPTNALKKNQDSLIMTEDFPTRTLMFVCLDGHGVNGDRVSQFVKQELETNLFSHRLFVDDMKAAIREVLFDIEKKLALLDGRFGEFSGTTLSMAIIRGNTLVTVNIGDSRIVMAKHAPESIDLMNYRRRSRTDSWNSTAGSFDSLASSGETDLEQLSLSNSECSSKTSPENSLMQNSGTVSVNGGGCAMGLTDCREIKIQKHRDRVDSNPGSHSPLLPPLGRDTDSLAESLSSTSNSSTRHSSVSYVSGASICRTLSPQSEHRKRSRSNLSAEGLTVDHKPDLLQEYNRITSAGGRVFSVRYADGVVGPPRVWLGQSNVPGLAMSRSIGDFVVHTAGVVSTPDITEQELDYDNDCMLIVATDGIWDQMSNGEVVNIAAVHAHADEAVTALVNEARSRWLLREKNNMDDITACVIFLQGM